MSTVNERLGKLNTFRRIRQPSANKSGIPPSKSGTYTAPRYWRAMFVKRDRCS